MGLVFGYVWRRTGRLWPLIIAHGVIDTVAFVGYALLAEPPRLAGADSAFGVTATYILSVNGDRPPRPGPIRGPADDLRRSRRR